MVIFRKAMLLALFVTTSPMALIPAKQPHEWGKGYRLGSAADQEMDDATQQQDAQQPAALIANNADNQTPADAAEQTGTDVDVETHTGKCSHNTESAVQPQICVVFSLPKEVLARLINKFLPSRDAASFACTCTGFAQHARNMRQENRAHNQAQLIFALPMKVLLEILHQLDGRDLSRLHQACAQMSDLVHRCIHEELEPWLNPRINVESAVEHGNLCLVNRFLSPQLVGQIRGLRGDSILMCAVNARQVGVIEILLGNKNILDLISFTGAQYVLIFAMGRGSHLSNMLPTVLANDCILSVLTEDFLVFELAQTQNTEIQDLIIQAIEKKRRQEK